MVRILPCLLLIVLLSSCASVISRRTYKMGVRSNVKETKIRYKDSIYSLPAVIRVRRAKTSLSLDFITPDTIKPITVRAVLNPAFIVGNLGWMQAAPIAYLVDLTTTRRFTYGKNLFLNTADTSSTYPISSRRWKRYWDRSYAAKRGDISLILSIPVVNHFMFHPEGEPIKEAYGCLGLSAGLSYAFRDRRTIVLNGGVLIDMPAPFPAAYHFSGLQERRQATWLGILETHHLKRLSFGYGLCISRNTWKLEYARWDSAGPLPAGYPIVRSRTGAGIMVATYFRPNRVIDVGLLYRSSLLDLDKGRTAPYEHIISLDLAFPIGLFRSR